MVQVQRIYVRLEAVFGHEADTRSRDHVEVGATTLRALRSLPQGNSLASDFQAFPGAPFAARKPAVGTAEVRICPGEIRVIISVSEMLMTGDTEIQQPENQQELTLLPAYGHTYGDYDNANFIQERRC